MKVEKFAEGKSPAICKMSTCKLRNTKPTSKKPVFLFGKEKCNFSYILCL